MLTLPEYEQLWHQAAPHGFGMPPHVEMPVYIQYVQREIYLQDYLDLFSDDGHITYPRINLANGGFGVEVNGEIIPVDYDYPWDEGTRKKKRCISHIMVAEAPPTAIVNYFYYAGAGAINTGYFTAPYNAFFNVPPPGPRITDLLKFADAGFVLLDLFPFAARFTSKLRDSLVKENAVFLSTAKDFWENSANHYCLLNRIVALPRCNSISTIKACLGLPPIICHYLAQNLNGGLPPSPPIGNLGLNFRLKINTFLPPHLAIHPSGRFFARPPLGTQLVGCEGIFYPLLSILVPYYRCSCYNGAGMVPSALFIKNALCLR